MLVTQNSTMNALYLEMEMPLLLACLDSLEVLVKLSLPG